MKNSKLLLSVILVLLGGLGWYLLSEDSSPNSPQPASVYSDSISAPERPTFTTQEDTSEQDTADKKTAPSPVDEELAPGTALIKAVVITADLDSDKNRHLVVTVEEVVGYGSSISPIAGKEELTINVERFLKNNPDRKEFMQKGDTVTIVISSERGMNLGDSQSQKSWSLVDLKLQ
ncbi:hypothetical protein [Fodinibius sp. SL11]|uniref:hypothetical protein n=1 Tax=Fodinibius sp. SL11 TaxID=3425690 RepID=UPI003F8836AD